MWSPKLLFLPTIFLFHAYIKLFIVHFGTSEQSKIPLHVHYTKWLSYWAFIFFPPTEKTHGTRSPAKLYVSLCVWERGVNPVSAHPRPCYELCTVFVCDVYLFLCLVGFRVIYGALRAHLFFLSPHLLLRNHHHLLFLVSASQLWCRMRTGQLHFTSCEAIRENGWVKCSASKRTNKWFLLPQSISLIPPSFRTSVFMRVCLVFCFVLGF